MNIYGTDLDSFMRFNPKIQMNLISISGKLDEKFDLTRQYSKYKNVLTIDSDDITCSEYKENHIFPMNLLNESLANEINDFLNKSNLPILVHCSAGISRTGAVLYSANQNFDYSLNKLIVTFNGTVKIIPVSRDSFSKYFIPNKHWINLLNLSKNPNNLDD